MNLQNTKMATTEPNLPPTRNPDVGKPATTRAKKSAVGKTSRISGAELVPDIKERSIRRGVDTSFLYWVGVTPSCPVEFIDLAGINFPKVNAALIPDPMRTGRTVRQGKIGSIVRLTEDKIQMMREKLPRTVVRFLNDDGAKEEPGTGQNIGDVAQRPRRGQLITIPTDADIAQRRKLGKPTRAYTPDLLRDVPAARFMFAVLCDDQDQPERGEHYPEPLEETGLEWPGELAELSAILS